MGKKPSKTQTNKKKNPKKSSFGDIKKIDISKIKAKGQSEL